jgi:hypothetical protein
MKTASYLFTAPKHRFWDIFNAKEELGYEPEDDASSAKGVKGLT